MPFLASMSGIFNKMPEKFPRILSRDVCDVCHLLDKWKRFHKHCAMHSGLEGCGQVLDTQSEKNWEKHNLAF